MPKARPHLGNQRRLGQVRGAGSTEGASSNTSGVSDIRFARKLLKDAQRPVTCPPESNTLRAYVQQGLVPYFIRLAESPNEEVRQQAVRMLGFIAGDSSPLRDYVLHPEVGGLQPIIQFGFAWSVFPTFEPKNESTKISMMRDAACTLRNLCSGKPPPPFEWVAPALGTLEKLMKSSDIEVLTDTCWALSSLAYGPSEHIAAVIDAGVCNRLVELLLHRCSRLQTHALRAVGHIANGNEAQKKVACGALPALHKLLSNGRQAKAIRKKGCWIVKNITDGGLQHVADVIGNDLIPPVLGLLQADDIEIKNEAVAAICNISVAGPTEIGYLVEAGCIQPLVDLLGVCDELVLFNTLQTFENILQGGLEKKQETGLAGNPFEALIKEAGGLSSIGGLLSHPNGDVSLKAALLLTRFFHQNVPAGVSAPSGVQAAAPSGMAADASNATEPLMEPEPCEDSAEEPRRSRAWSMDDASLDCFTAPGKPSFADVFGKLVSKLDVPQGNIFHVPGQSPRDLSGVFGVPSQKSGANLFDTTTSSLKAEAVFGEALPSSDSGIFVFGLSHLEPCPEEDSTCASEPMQTAREDYDSDDMPEVEDQEDFVSVVDSDGMPGPPAPPDGACSWEWPLSRQEKKTRVGALERMERQVDQHLLLKELAELREFRQCHESAWKTHMKRRSIC